MSGEEENLGDLVRNEGVEAPAALPPAPEEAAPPAAPAAAAAAANKKKSVASSALQNARTRKFKELQGIWTDKFKNIPEKFRPKAKSYDAFALAGKPENVQKQKLNAMLARDRKEAEDKIKGIFPKRGPRQPKEGALAPIAEASKAAAPKSKAAPAPAAPAGNGKAANIRRQIAELQQKAANAERREEAERVEREAKEAANALRAAANASAQRLEAQARDNIRAAMNGRDPPPNFVKGLAMMRQAGKNIAAQDFISFCSFCKGTRKARKNKGTSRGPRNKSAKKKNNNNANSSGNGNNA